MHTLPKYPSQAKLESSAVGPLQITLIILLAISLTLLAIVSFAYYDGRNTINTSEAKEIAYGYVIQDCLKASAKDPQLDCGALELYNTYYSPEDIATVGYWSFNYDTMPKSPISYQFMVYVSQNGDRLMAKDFQ